MHKLSAGRGGAGRAGTDTTLQGTAWAPPHARTGNARRPGRAAPRRRALCQAPQTARPAPPCGALRAQSGGCPSAGRGMGARVQGVWGGWGGIGGGGGVGGRWGGLSRLFASARQQVKCSTPRPWCFRCSTPSWQRRAGSAGRGALWQGCLVQAAGFQQSRHPTGWSTGVWQPLHSVHGRGAMGPEGGRARGPEAGPCLRHEARHHRHQRLAGVHRQAQALQTSGGSTAGVVLPVGIMVSPVLAAVGIVVSTEQPPVWVPSLVGRALPPAG